MRIAWAIVAIFGARFAAIAWHYRGQDADLSWQRWLGNQVLTLHHIPMQLGLETFTATGSRWIAQEWLFSTAIAATLPNGRFYVLAIACALAAVCALAVTAWRAHRRGASTFATVLTTAFVGFAMMQSFGVRAQIFGWALLAIIMLLLDLESPLIFLIIPLTVLMGEYSRQRPDRAGAGRNLDARHGDRRSRLDRARRTERRADVRHVFGRSAHAVLLASSGLRDTAANQCDPRFDQRMAAARHHDSVFRRRLAAADCAGMLLRHRRAARTLAGRHALRGYDGTFVHRHPAHVALRARHRADGGAAFEQCDSAACALKRCAERTVQRSAWSLYRAPSPRS